MILALTGATGFVGGALLDHALAAGHEVRALTRRPQPARAGVTWIDGDLARPGALAEGADAVVHVAGVVGARDRAAFAEGNIAGTDSIVAATKAAGVTKFVHVSSLAAREPGISDYGWSKAGGENAAIASGLDWTVVRPPAVYGPRDTELRDVFRMAKFGIALLPPPGRISLLHVDDLARLLLACATGDPGRVILESDDGAPMTHADFARAVGTAVGRRVLPLPLPRALLFVAARVDRLLRGDGAKLTPDRVAYMSHPDWTARLRPDPAFWRPEIAAAQGLAATAEWYRREGLL